MMKLPAQKFIQGLANGYDLITENTHHLHPPKTVDSAVGSRTDDHASLLDKQGVPISSKAVLFALITAVWAAIFISMVLFVLINI